MYISHTFWFVFSWNKFLLSEMFLIDVHSVVETPSNEFEHLVWQTLTKDWIWSGCCTEANSVYWLKMNNFIKEKNAYPRYSHKLTIPLDDWISRGCFSIDGNITNFKNEMPTQNGGIWYDLRIKFQEVVSPLMPVYSKWRIEVHRFHSRRNFPPMIIIDWGHFSIDANRI